MAKLAHRLGALGSLFLVACAASGCVGPNTRVQGGASKPGWGGVPQTERLLTSTRAVEAALSPTPPLARRGKPGWGR